MADKREITFRTLGYGERVISLIPKIKSDANARVFAYFKDTKLEKATPEILKLLAEKHDEYEAKNVPINTRGFVSEEVYDAVVTPDRTYFKYNGKMIHSKDVIKGLEIAEKNGWTAPDKNYIFVNLPQIHKTSINAT